MSRRTYCKRVLGDLRRRTDRRWPARPRGTRARAAPGRRASSRSAARATRRRPSSDGSRRRCDRACRPSAIARSVVQRHVARVGVAGARVLAQQEQQLARPRKLRRAAEPAAPRVERRARTAAARPIERRRHGGTVAPAAAPRSAHCRRSVRLADGLDHCRPLVAPGARDLVQHVDEPRPPPARRRREVRAAVERLQLGRQPHAHRPAAGAGRRLHERHVDAIHVRALFAIDLDRDEVAIEHVGHLGVLERLVLHDVAPVTGRVADRQEDRLVLAPRPRERLVAPRIPVHRVVRVLQQVGALLGRQAIGHVSSIAVANGGSAAAKRSALVTSAIASAPHPNPSGSRSRPTGTV